MIGDSIIIDGASIDVGEGDYPRSRVGKSEPILRARFFYGREIKN
jgi:hypothetical protein